MPRLRSALQQKPPHLWHSPPRPQPQGPVLAQTKSPQVGMTSQEVSRTISDHDPPPTVHAPTPGAGGGVGRQGSQALQLPRGGAGLGCRAAVGVSPLLSTGPPPSRRPSPACSETGAGAQLHVAVKLTSGHGRQPLPPTTPPVCSLNTRRHEDTAWWVCAQ